MEQRISFADGFLLIFAINDKESFELLKGIKDKILKEKHMKKFPIILVGNKNDLENERKVDYSEAKALADSWKCEYIETSEKTNYNCKEIFNKLIENIIKPKSNSVKNGHKCSII